MPGARPLPKPSTLLRRVENERWLLDAARQTPLAHRARRVMEQVRVQARIRRAGGIDEALDQIVADAIGQGAHGE